MAEQNSTFLVNLGGREVTVKQPTDGQVESMVRIASGLQAEGDQGGDFWIKHIQRLNRLLNSLIDPADHDYVDELYDTGQISSSALLRAILGKVKEDSSKAPKNGPVKKAAVRRVRSK